MWSCKMLKDIRQNHVATITIIYIRLIELSLRSTNCLFFITKRIFFAQTSFILSLLHSKLSEAQIVKKTGVSLSTISRTSSDKRIVILWNFSLLILHTPRNFYKQIKLKMLFKLPTSYLMLSSHFSLHKLQEEGQRKVDGGL